MCVLAQTLILSESGNTLSETDGGGCLLLLRGDDVKDGSLSFSLSLGSFSFSLSFTISFFDFFGGTA